MTKPANGKRAPKAVSLFGIPKWISHLPNKDSSSELSCCEDVGRQCKFPKRKVNKWIFISGNWRIFGLSLHTLAQLKEIKLNETVTDREDTQINHPKRAKANWRGYQKEDPCQLSYFSDEYKCKWITRWIIARTKIEQTGSSTLVVCPYFQSKHGFSKSPSLEMPRSQGNSKHQCCPNLSSCRPPSRDSHLEKQARRRLIVASLLKSKEQTEHWQYTMGDQNRQRWHEWAD